MARIKRFMNEQYFNDRLPFEYRMFMIFFLEAFVLSILSATTNTLLGKGLAGIIFQWSFIAVMLVLLIGPIKLRQAVQKPLLLFASFVYVPFLSFQTAGYHGTATLFTLVAMLLLVVLFKGKQRTLLIISNILLWVVVCVVQYRYPALVVPHGAEIAALIDCVVALILTLGSIAILGIYFRDQLSKEMENVSRLNKQLEENNQQLKIMTIQDPLTGVYNRRYLNLYLEDELAKVAVSQTKLFLLMLDVDHFKAVNDTYGHQVGDEVLLQLAQVLQGTVRGKDIVARFGGEEFVVVLQNLTATHAMEIAQRIRGEVAGLQFSQELHLTVSIGLTQAKAGDSYAQLISSADEALYRAKAQGRNCVVASD